MTVSSGNRMDSDEGIERLAEAVMPIERVPEEYRLAAGAEQENATLSLTTDYASLESDLSGGSFSPVAGWPSSSPSCAASFAVIRTSSRARAAATSAALSTPRSTVKPRL